MVIFSIYENFAVEVVNGQHFLACLSVREYWWVFVGICDFFENFWIGTWSYMS